MRLCALLKITSRRHLKQILTYQELAEWREFYRVDPWDQDRYDLRNGQLIAAVLSPHVKKAPHPAKFMLYHKYVPKAMPEAEMKAVIKGCLSAFNPKPKPKITEDRGQRTEENGG